MLMPTATNAMKTATATKTVFDVDWSGNSTGASSGRDQRDAA